MRTKRRSTYRIVVDVDHSESTVGRVNSEAGAVVHVAIRVCDILEERLVHGVASRHSIDVAGVSDVYFRESRGVQTTCMPANGGILCVCVFITCANFKCVIVCLSIYLYIYVYT